MGLEKITHYDLAGIFDNAYSQVARTVEAVTGFKATGIHVYPSESSPFSE
jgi:hypothetical protein